jgi:hypothetical protein
MEIEIKKKYQSEILDYTDFSNQCLIGVHFSKCSLRFCSFRHSDLSYTIFEECDLYSTDFEESVLYSTRIHNSDCTKTSFVKAFLNGLKVKEIFVVKTNFGFDFNTNKERKPILVSETNIENFYVCPLGKMQSSVKEIEDNNIGIFCPTTNIAIKFIDTTKDKRNVWLRKSEISKILKLILEQNGYSDKSLDYYFYHRRFLRKSQNNIFKRMIDFLFGELFWGYGVRIVNPMISFFINLFFFAILYVLSPYIFSEPSGMCIDQNLLFVYTQEEGFCVANFFEILYGTTLISALSAFGSIAVIGFARIFAILQILISIVLLGIGITALGKRMANT